MKSQQSTTIRARVCLLALALVMLPGVASPATFVSSTPIAGDSVPVTLVLEDAAEGDAVEVLLSIPEGSGDLLGLFGNALPESLVPGMAVVDASGVVTQWQFAANQVWKVGGGNVMTPVRNWDWGLRFGSAGSAGGAVTQVTFRLTAPGLEVASLTEAFNQGWRFGVRIQGTSGPEGSAKIGIASSAPPEGQAPSVAIAAPGDGALLSTAEVSVSGTVGGTPPVAVAVNGVAATVSGSGFEALLSLPDGPHTLTAVATNAFGTASDAVAVTVDTTPPVVTTVVPEPGTLTAAASLVVSGTVADASPIASVLVNGIAAALDGDAFTAEVPLALGENELTATAIDAAGNVGSDSVSVIRGAPPAISITAPGEGALLGASPVTVTGTVSGTGPIAVDVGGVAAAVTAGAFTASLPLPDGSHSVTATATSLFGTASDSVSFELDTTPPVVTITSPASGATVGEQPISVTGTVADASPIVDLRIDGDPIFFASPFSITAALAEGPNTITVEATDAAGNVGSAQVTVTYQPVVGLSIAIETPPDGALLSRARVEVAGTVTDPAAAVVVNGVLATVTGQRWVAAAVPLEEGPNTLSATATHGTSTASAAVSVLYNAPPRVVITSPANGDLFRVDRTDVEGVVDDMGAFVDVNGVVASVGAGGRFLAPSVPLAPGDNTLVARAIDVLGARGTDEVAVVRDDGAPTRAHLVVLDHGNRWVWGAGIVAFSTLEDWDENLRIGNESPFFEHPFPVTRQRLAPTLDAAVVEPGGSIFVLTEFGEPTVFEAFLEGESTPFVGPVTVSPSPIEALPEDLDPTWLAYPVALAPPDFDAAFYAFADLLTACLPDSCPVGSITEERVRIRATTAGRQKEIPLRTDIRRPTMTITSPEEGSVLGGDTVTVAGTVTDAHALLDTVAWEIRNEFGVRIDQGTAPLLFDDPAPGDAERAQARFVLPDLAVGPGLHSVHLRAWDAIGNFRTQFTFFDIDPAAPAVALVWPRDGSAQVEEVAPITLNFAAATTLVAVNGVPDGRSFDPGLAAEVLTPALAIGPNRFVLELESGGVAFTFSFTLHRVEALGGVRIVSPPAGAFVNQEALTVVGTVPLGTPAVEVNGVLATVAPDGVSFSASIPIPRFPGIVLEGGELRTKPHPITAVALPLGATATIEVTPDFGAPLFRTIVPADGSFTNEEDVAVTGHVSEPATLFLSGPDGTVSGRTIRDLARERIERIENPRLFSFGGEQFHRFELPRLAIASGENELTLTAVDHAGNETALSFHVTRRESVLSLVSPAPGTAVPALVTDVTLAAAAPVTIDAWFVGGRLVPALGGASVPAGSFIAPAVPLGPGMNEMRVVYRQAGGGPEVVRFAVESLASDAALVGGQVTNGLVGTPIAGALVSITVGGVTVVAVTDADGRYQVPVAPGPVSVVAAAEYYASVTVTGAVDPGATFTADPVLSPTGVPALANELRILVPPDGAVTDWEQVTVVGTVLNPASQVTVNGIAAEVVGNRFTARHVPLSPGPNGIQASAVALGLPNAVSGVLVERSDSPVLDVELFSPPDGATIPGGGLVVRGWVSATNARVLAGDLPALASEGIFEVFDVPLVAGESEILAAAQVASGPLVEDAIRIHTQSPDPALRLEADPASGVAPLDVSLRTILRSSFAVRRIDFDRDGDGVIDLPAHESGDAQSTYPAPRPHRPRVFLTTPENVELSASTRVSAFLAPIVLRSFAAGNPVDLAEGSDGSLYVLDGVAGRVQRFAPEGDLLQTIGASGSGADQLSNPQGLAVAPDGTVYVADTGNDRIQVFGVDGTWVRSIGGQGTALGRFRGPRAVALDDDGRTLIVADTGNGRIQRFDPDGTRVGTMPFRGATGLARVRGSGVVIASPAEAALRAVVDGVFHEIPALDQLPQAATPVGPIDVIEGADGVVIADAAANRLVVLDPQYRLRRIAELDSAPRAVLSGRRPEIESVYVADGAQVREIGFPTDSPLPTVDGLRSSLAAGDIEAALGWIAPAERARFRALYGLLEPVLAEEAAGMNEPIVLRLREDQAIVILRREEQFEGQAVVNGYPMHLIRNGSGEWRVLDY